MVQPSRGHLTAALAAHVADPERTLPGDVAELVTAAVLDTVGCALAGADEPAVTALRAATVAPPGPATVLVDRTADGARADAVHAALVNGTAAHALDYDDVDDLLTAHPSTVLVPAALAVAQQVGASGREVAVAYHRGLTAMRALGAGLGIGPHYARGWHSTSTLGVLGAAAAAAVLLGLDATRAGHALGVAASRAAGTRANFGSMTKPLHAGAAAADGVLAARLAAAGFTADPAALDGPLGFLTLYRGAPGKPDADALLTALADPDPPGLDVKLHPCCYATHAPIDAALDLVAAGLAPDDVAAVAVRVPPGGLAPLLDHPPRTELEGKFSMGYTVAAALHDGAVTLSTFTDEAVTRPAVAALADLVTATESLPRVTATESLPGSGGGLEFRAEVTVTTRDGAARTAVADAPHGHVTRPAGAAARRAKFDDCLARGGFAAAAPALWDTLSGLPGLADLDAALAQVSR